MKDNGTKTSVGAWTALIFGYVDSLSRQAERRWEGTSGSESKAWKAYAFVSLVKACGILSDLEERKRIHAEVVVGNELYSGHIYGSGGP